MALFGVNGAITGVITHIADVSPQKSALGQMHEMLREFQELYHDAPAGHHSVDANGVITQINQTELDWLGYAREEVIGRLRLRDVLAPESAQRQGQDLNRLREANRIEEIEYDFRRKDGTSFPAVISAKAILHSDGAFAGGRATVINITERRRMETAIQRSEADLKRAQMLAQSGNYQFEHSTTAGNRAFRWSPELYRILGRDLEEGPIPTSDFITNIIHHDDRERVKKVALAALTERAGFETEYRIVRADDSLRHVRDLGEFDYDEKTGNGHYFGVIQDVTELHHARAQAHKRERLFATLVENSYDGITLFQADGRVSYVSPTATRILGYPAEAFFGEPVFGYIHPDDKRAVKERMLTLVQNPGAQITSEFRFRRRNGTWAWVEVTDSNHLHNEAVGAVVTNFRDITERKAWETELLSTNDRLLELSRHLRTSIELERTRIARELHDELGSLLTAIKMYASSPANPANATSGDAQPRVMKLLDTATESIARIVTNLRPSVLDHRGVIPAIQRLTTEFEEQAGVVCDFTTTLTAHETNLVEVEKTVLFRICQEALNNVARHAKASAVSVTIKRDATALLLEIRDDGVGFDDHGSTDRPSWGIIGMRERASELGGRLETQAVAAGGTGVMVRVPWSHFETAATQQIQSMDSVRNVGK